MEPETDKNAPGTDGPDIFTALKMVRTRRHKVAKAKRRAEEITYLNIVAMMDMMTIILVFMLKSVSFSTTLVSGTEALALPYSTTQLQPIEAVKVFVTKDEIVVEDKKVAAIHNGRIDDEYMSSQYIIPNLKQRLGEEVKRQMNLQRLRPGLKFEGNLTVLADKDTPYQIIMQVLYSAGQASIPDENDPSKSVGLTKFRLTVMRSDT